MGKSTKQKLMKEHIDEIRQENRLVAQRRAEKESDLVEEMKSIPKGRGPFYGNRATFRSTVKQLRKSMSIGKKEVPLQQMDMIKSKRP